MNLNYVVHKAQIYRSVFSSWGTKGEFPSFFLKHWAGSSLMPGLSLQFLLVFQLPPLLLLRAAPVPFLSSGNSWSGNSCPSAPDPRVSAHPTPTMLF